MILAPQANVKWTLAPQANVKWFYSLVGGRKESL